MAQIVRRWIIRLLEGVLGWVDEDATLISRVRTVWAMPERDGVMVIVDRLTLADLGGEAKNHRALALSLKAYPHLQDRKGDLKLLIELILQARWG